MNFFDQLNSNFVFHMSLKRECLEHLRDVEQEAREKDLQK